MSRQQQAAANNASHRGCACLHLPFPPEHRGGSSPAKPVRPNSQAVNWDAELASAIAHEKQAEQAALAAGATGADGQGEDVTEEGWLPR